MKNTLIVPLLLCFGTVRVAAQSLDFTAVRAEVDFATQLQTWDGFGFNYVETCQTRDYNQDPQEYGGFSLLTEADKAKIVDLVFGEDGLKVGLLKMCWSKMNASNIKEHHGNIYTAKVNGIIPWAGIQRPTKWVGGDPNPGSAFTVHEDGFFANRSADRATSRKTEVPKTMNEIGIARIEKLLRHLEANKDRLTIDADVHLTVHFGADTPFTPADGLERMARLHPDHPVLAVHMGGGGAGYLEAEELYRQARELGLRQPNIRFILSARRDTVIESDLITYQLAGEPSCRNLFCGSDAPYGRMTWNFGGFRCMFQSLQNGAAHTDPRLRANPGLFTADIAQNYLGRNFAKFVIAACRHLLEVQKPILESAFPAGERS